MRSLDVAAERLNSALDVLLRAGNVLTNAPNVGDALGQIAELCAGGLAEYCSIRVVIDALERDEFSVSAGAHPGQPTDPSQRIVETLAAGRRTFGSIVCETSQPLGFDEMQRQIVTLLAQQLSVVVAGQAAAMREHRVADRFQRALLPDRLPDVPGVAFSAAYRPASDEAEVGGDWYDAFAQPDGRIAISIGDVAGHGLDAAVIMGEVRQAMRTAAVGSSVTPADVLNYVNDVVRLRESIGMVTAIFGTYDPETGAFVYAVAGHPPPILTLEGGVTRRLPASGLPLGCAPDVETAVWTFTVPQDARVVLYTDGLIENERDILQGEERLLDAVRALQIERSTDPANELLPRIFDAGGNRDDAAVLVLERTTPVSSYTFSAHSVVSPLARAIVERRLRALEVSEDRRFGVLVAVGEAIANAVEHAYRGGEPGLIRLGIELQPPALSITVEDYGRWRPFVRREERGRGIELMHAFADGVQIHSRRESTAIVLKVKLDPGEAGESPNLGEKSPP